MASPDALEQTDVRLGLLRDVANDNVADDADHTPWLHIEGEAPADVRHTIWEMERHRWIFQPEGTSRWDPTDYGWRLLEEAGRG